jgi:hypothetical protein
VRLQRFLVYAERGLARRRVSIWVYDERLRVEYDQTLLAQYAVQYDRRRKRIAQVTDPVVYPLTFTHISKDGRVGTRTGQRVPSSSHRWRQT